jgi:hypothetical protein
MAEGSSTMIATAQGTDYASVDSLFEQSCKKLAEAHKLCPVDSQVRAALPVSSLERLPCSN